LGRQRFRAARDNRPGPNYTACMRPTEWLLAGDPAIRWQALRDLTDAPALEVEAERARVASEGWGARLLALQGEDGQWAGGACFPAPSENWRGEKGQPWTSTLPVLQLLSPSKTATAAPAAGTPCARCASCAGPTAPEVGLDPGTNRARGRRAGSRRARGAARTRDAASSGQRPRRAPGSARRSRSPRRAPPG